MNPIPGTDWANFFVAEVGASAALSGLVVVAISINLARILEIKSLPDRAAEALIILIGALLLTSAGLVPNQSAAVFGALTLVIGLVMFTVTAAIQLQSPTNAQIPRWRRNIRPLMNAAASLPIIAGGMLLILGSASGLYWLAAGVVRSPASSTPGFC
jgi:hypothetical protein